MGASSEGPTYSAFHNKVAPEDGSTGTGGRRPSMKQARKSIKRQSVPFLSRQSLKQAIRRGTLGSQSNLKSSGAGKQKLTRQVTLPKRKESVLPDIFINIPKGKSKHLPKSEYPPVLPPRIRRENIFQDHRYVGLDNFVSKVPTIALYGDFDEVASFLTKTCRTDIEKLRALFAWTTSIDIPTLQSSLEEIPDVGTPLDYLLHINWKKGNLPTFFAKMCRSAEIPAFIVCGMSKNSAYEVGGSCNRTKLASQWNAVYVAREWRLVDVFWGCRCIIDPRSDEWVESGKESIPFDIEGDPVKGEHKHYRNSAYFLMDPDQMIKTHFPDEEKWQLLPGPIDVDEFKKAPYIRERFHRLGMTMKGESYKTCVTTTVKGEIEFIFGLPSDRSKNFRFKYIVFKQATQQDDTRFDQYVFYQKKSNVVKFRISFPVTGIFKLHIYGLDETKDRKFDLCAAYIIHCEEAAEKVEPLPDIPEIGWGAGSDLEKLGLVSVNNEAPIIQTKDGNVEIRFSMHHPVSIKGHLKSSVGDELELAKYVMTTIVNQEVIVSLRLPSKGEYALNIHGADATAKGELPTVCNFLVKCEEDNKTNVFPRLHEGGLGRGHLADEFGIFPKSHPEEVINAEEADLAIEFEVRASLESDIKDTQLFCELQCNDVQGKELADSLTYKKDGASHVFDLKLPKAAEYAMNVYARKQTKSDSVHHVFTYLIISTQTTQNEDTHGKIFKPVYQTVRTKKGKKKIRLPTTGAEHVVDFVRRKAKEVITYELKATRVGNDFLFEVKLPEVGEYVLDVFEEYRNTLVLVAEYYIIREPLNIEAPLPPEPPPKKEPAPPPDSKEPLKPEEVAERAKQFAEEDAKHDAAEEAKLDAIQNKETRERELKQKLQAAMTSDDPTELPPALHEFEAEKGLADKNPELYKKAKFEMKLNPCKQGLASALRRRKLIPLRAAIDRVDREGFGRNLGLQYQMAVKTRDKLAAIAKLSADIVAMDTASIVEIRSYEKPPTELHFIMSATLMVLGELEKNVKDWRDVVIQMSKTGSVSLKKRIQEFDSTKLDVKTAKKATMMIEQYSTDQLAVINRGLVLFFIWTRAVLDEVITQFERDGVEMEAVNVARNKKKKQSIKPATP